MVFSFWPHVLSKLVFMGSVAFRLPFSSMCHFPTRFHGGYYSSPNLVFVACVAFSVVFWHLLLYKCHSVFIPPFFGQLNSGSVFKDCSWTYPSNYWNSAAIFINFEILILSSQTVEFWSYFYKHWKYYVINPNIRILFLSFQSLEFYPCCFNIRILILSFQTL